MICVLDVENQQDQHHQIDSNHFQFSPLLLPIQVIIQVHHAHPLLQTVVHVVRMKYKIMNQLYLTLAQLTVTTNLHMKWTGNIHMLTGKCE